ncbi:MAG: nucleotidyl transferase AbiEii/AbiGii toxin family protein [Elusimicrobiota bacterium]
MTLAAEKRIPAAIVEKDYWVMHCLWGLKEQGFRFDMKGGTSLSKGWLCVDRFSEDIDIRFDPPAGLNVKGDKEAHVKARFDYFDDLAGKIRVPDVKTERVRDQDDKKAQNGGIGLKYPSHFEPMPGLRQEVLLEAGFARTVPNEPRDFTSWALDKALEAKLAVADNRARAVRCFNPEYTFVDKLQTICRRFRQHRDRNDPKADRPREFLRHYLDLYRLLEVERVRQFIGTPEYEAYKNEKLRGADVQEFAAKAAFALPDEKTFRLFEDEFAVMNTLLLSPGPTFKELIDRLRQKAASF